jgi:hypothetical protein
VDVDIEPIGHVRMWPHYPRHVFVHPPYDDERANDWTRGIVLAETDSAELARWLVDSITACIAGASHIAPRPTGTVLRRGEFEIMEDEYLRMGWYYGVANDTVTSSGVPLCRSKDTAHVEEIIQQVTTLMA